jgi:hypothetical protein
MRHRWKIALTARSVSAMCPLARYAKVYAYDERSGLFGLENPS